MRRRPTSRIVAAVVAALAAAPLLAGCGGGGSIKLTATFDDAGDLVKGHSVQMADVRIGRITGIKLTDDFEAKVTMSVRRSAHVPKAVTAYLRTTSLLGEKFVELRPDDPSHAARGPYLRDGDVVRRTAQAPEIEFVAEQAISVLGAVTADDVATLIDTGAAALAGRGNDLKGLIGDLATISHTLASRTGEITTIIDHLDRATATLASGKADVAQLLTELAGTTKVLADNRQRAVAALAQLSRLAAVNNEVLTKYSANIDRQIKQVDAVLASAVTATGELGSLIDWLSRFNANVPKVIPDDFTQVSMWLVPQPQDPRTNGGGR